MAIKDTIKWSVAVHCEVFANTV